MNTRRLILQNALNVRDLGGFSTLNNQITLFHQFLRSDDLSKLNKQDLDTLYNYGIRYVIDLRSPFECEAKKDACKDDPRFTYINHQLMSNTVWNYASIDHPGYRADYDMGDLYVCMLQDHAIIAQLFKILLNCDNGGVLFHCSAGKDRTGITAMMLLMLANVPIVDIIVDYASSYVYLTHNTDFLVSISKGVDSGMLLSDPSYIQKGIDYILSFGSIENYLQTIGLTLEQINQLRKRIVISNIDASIEL